MNPYPRGADVQRSAKLSQDDAYLYSLTRAWGRQGSVMRVVTLFPTLDDPTEDDALTRTLAAYAVRLGHVSLIIYNLYALRVTKAMDLWKGADPVGPANDQVIMAAANDAHAKNAGLIAAWGAGAKDERIKHVRAMTDGVRWSTFGPVMPSGHPRHPLFLGGNSALQPLAPVRHV